jgi:hypothetical protein
MQFTHAFVPAIVFRCLIWAMTAGFIAAGLAPQGTVAQPTLLIVGGSTALYTLAWCFFLPRLAYWITRFPALLLLDIILSAVPASISGGWLSPFAPFGLGALMLPGALFHWRGVAAALTSFVLVDQLVGWTTWPADRTIAAHWSLFVFGYLRALVAATIWPTSFALWKWHARRLLPHSDQSDPREHVAPGKHLRPAAPEPPRTSPARAEGRLHASTAWRIVRQPAQTLEHVPVALHTAIGQAIAEAEERGLQVRLTLATHEPTLPESHVQLLAKAVEISLDNIHIHAGSRDAEVTLAVEEHTSAPEVVLSVRDHGNGLLDGTADLPGFHQLRRLRYRLEEVEGSLDVHEDDTGGVVFVVRVPVV